jgi:phage gp37-like protein
MSEYAWTVLEDAVLAALAAGLGSRVQTIQSYQGDYLADLRGEARRLPAVLLMLGSSRGEQVTAASYDYTLDFTVLVADRQLRGEAGGRRRERGVYDILEGVRQALWHQDLGLEILPCSLVREEPLVSTRELIVYAAHYRTGEVHDLAPK